MAKFLFSPQASRRAWYNVPVTGSFDRRYLLEATFHVGSGDRAINKRNFHSPLTGINSPPRVEANRG